MHTRRVRSEKQKVVFEFVRSRRSLESANVSLLSVCMIPGRDNEDEDGPDDDTPKYMQQKLSVRSP